MRSIFILLNNILCQWNAHVKWKVEVLVPISLIASRNPVTLKPKPASVLNKKTTTVRSIQYMRQKK
ncbi:unnamed protein product [Ixodes pacificus]